MFADQREVGREKEQIQLLTRSNVVITLVYIRFDLKFWSKRCLIAHTITYFCKGWHRWHVYPPTSQLTTLIDVLLKCLTPLSLFSSQPCWACTKMVTARRVWLWGNLTFAYQYLNFKWQQKGRNGGSASIIQQGSWCFSCQGGYMCIWVISIKQYSSPEVTQWRQLLYNTHGHEFESWH